MRKCYGRANEGEAKRIDHHNKGSAFVTGGALFSIKLIGSDAEHVVALDANAVEDSTANGGGVRRFTLVSGMRIDGLAGDVVGRHAGILTR